MDFTTITNEFNKAQSEFLEKQKEFKEVLRSVYHLVFAEFFKEYPVVKTIHWTQYIPSFNDGDECTFTMNDIYFTKTDVEDLEDIDAEEDEGNISERRYDYNLKRYVQNEEPVVGLFEAMRKMESFINAAEEINQEAFDINAWVRATAECITHKEYDCGY